jgi:hypothetical protein
MLIERERARIKKRPTTKAACCCGNQKNTHTHTHTHKYRSIAEGRPCPSKLSQIKTNHLVTELIEKHIITKQEHRLF